MENKTLMLNLKRKPLPIPITKRLANNLPDTCRKMLHTAKTPSLVSIRRAMEREEGTKITLVKTIEAAIRTTRMEMEIKQRVKLGGAVLRIIGINLLTKKEGQDLIMLVI
jgi:valyl-tRNA synthetase